MCKFINAGCVVRFRRALHQYYKIVIYDRECHIIWIGSKCPTSGKCLVWYTRANANKHHKFHSRNSQRPRAKVSTSSSERRENGSPVNEWNFNLCFSSALAATRYYERLAPKFVSKKILAGRAVAVGETRSFVFMTGCGSVKRTY